jgi:hypothetical protein
MFKFDRNRNKVICPKCLKEIALGKDISQAQKCVAGLGQDGCYQPFPLRYAREFDTAETLPIQVFGWSGHGKTVFLDALRLMLLNMRKLWTEYTFQSISELDMTKERELRGTLQQGKMPPSTQRVKDLGDLDVYVMKLERMMGYRDKWLIVMDYPGELFQDFKVQSHLMPFLKNSNTTFLIISLPLLTDPNNTTGESIDQLINIYIETMLRMEEADKLNKNVKKKDKFIFAGQKRQVIVVFTMSDLIFGYIPLELRRYLQSDTMWSRLHTTGSKPFSPEEMQDYYQEMGNISEHIRDWLLSDTVNVPGGSNLVGLLENTGITTHYALISAVGYQPEEKNLMPIQPKRVIDPFLWALEFDYRIRS